MSRRVQIMRVSLHGLSKQLNLPQGVKIVRVLAADDADAAVHTVRFVLEGAELPLVQEGEMPLYYTGQACCVVKES